MHKAVAATSVVVITEEIDAHLPYVQRHLKQPLYVIDPKKLLTGDTFTYQITHKKLILTHKGNTLDKVRGVWYRKPGDFTAGDLSVSPQLKSYSLGALQAHIANLREAFQDAVWISDFHTMRRAGNKGWQLALASQIGLRTPETVMTSDPSTAKEFITKHSRCIVKPYLSYSPTVGDPSKSFLATLIMDAHLPDLTKLHLAPAIFQQHIDTFSDVRVTVVGKKVFAARILNEKLDKTSKVRDWRIGHYEGDMQITIFKDFPKDVSSRCIELVRRMGLNFGAIDFVEDQNGVLWFLEINPNGQWAFVEEVTGQPIGKAIAYLLETGKANPQATQFA